MATIFDRVNADLERGDLGAARMRLASYIRGGGYDAAVVAEIARISAEMGDPAEAGRYWLVSDETGEEVEQAVARFIIRAGRTPQGVASHLPRRLRLKSLANYPPAAQERLQRLQLADAIVGADNASRGGRTAKTVIERVMAAGCLLALLFAFSAFLVGAGVILRAAGRQIPWP